MLTMKIRFPLILAALAIADRRGLLKRDKDILSGTGTGHLLAISGLHIGLASLFAYVLIRWMLPVYFMKRCPAQHIALAGGVVASLDMDVIISGIHQPRWYHTAWAKLRMNDNK